MKTTINYIKIAFIIYSACNSIIATATIVDCTNSKQYNYGKRFFNGQIHDLEEIYSLNNIFKPSQKNNTVINNTLTVKNNKPEVFIESKQLQNHIVILVSIKNTSDEQIIIPKKNISKNGWLSGPIFSISSDCINLDYLGPLVNFGSTYTYPEDYVVIEPNQIFNDSIKIDEYYHFIPGSYRYLITIPNIYFSSSINSPLTNHLTKSNTISLKIDNLDLNKNIQSDYCPEDGCSKNNSRLINQRAADNIIFQKSGSISPNNGKWFPVTGFNEKGITFTKGETFPKWEINGSLINIEWFYRTP